MAAPEPVVTATEQGAVELGALYWREVERFMRGLVAANVNADRSAAAPATRRPRPPRRSARATVENEGALYVPDRQRLPRAQGRWDDLVFARDGSAAHARLRHQRVLPAPRCPPWATCGPARSTSRFSAASTRPSPSATSTPSRRRAGMKVVVFGATGTIGAALVTVLTGDHDVTAVSRSPEETRDQQGALGARRRDDEQSIAGAMEGAEVAYYLVHSLGQARFEERERRSADGFARAAEKAGLRQIVYLGGLGDDADDLSPHLRSRRETEQRLAARSVPVTTLRAGMVIARGSAAFETIAALVDRLPAMILPRWAKTPTQPIALVDVVRYLGVCANGDAFGQTYDVGGPEVMSYADMIRRVARSRAAHPTWSRCRS